MPPLDSAHWLLLITVSFFVGIFAAVVGGGFFFSVPFMQWMFPEVAFGVLIGNLKVGSFFRSIGTIGSTWRQIEYRENMKTSAFAFLGTVIGSSFIANLNQKWLFPAVIVAVILAEAAPRVAKYITSRSFNIAAFLTGAYAGVFGAGVGVMLIALLRLKHTKDAEIAFVKIQARFVEFLLVIAAVVTHFLHGNLVSAMWVPWSSGALVGGYVGGHALDRIGRMPGQVQAYILYAAFAVSIAVAGIKFFE
jgi:uncharacterized membrane protein YfcA